MTKQRMNWEKARRDRWATETIHAAQDDFRRVSEESNRHQNAVDIQWLQLILRYPKLRPYHRAMVEASIAWLQAVPTRTLGPRGSRSGWRTLYEALVARIQIGSYGEPLPDELRAQSIAKANRRQVCRVARNEERKAYVPAWAVDPTLLPKRPPL